MGRIRFVWVRTSHRVVVHEGAGCNQPPEENTAAAAINDVVSKGISMGKAAATQVKQFDEKHGLSATAVATASSVDEKLGISEKFSAGTSAINQQLRAVDEKYHVCEKTKSALGVAEEKASVAGSAITRNVLIGASWVTGAVSKVAKAADEVVRKAKERATGSDLPENLGEPYGGGYSSVNTARISPQPPAPPRLYEYCPHGALLRVVGS